MGALQKVRYEMFCQEYMKDKNGSAAVLRTGYKVKHPNVMAAKLLARPNIRARIDELVAERSAAAAVDAEYVLSGLKKVYDRAMQPEPVMVWDNDLNQFVQKTDENGNPIFKFDSQGANRALELIGKHIGLFEKDNAQKQMVFNVVFTDEMEEQEQQQQTEDITHEEIQTLPPVIVQKMEEVKQQQKIPPRRGEELDGEQIVIR